MTSERGADARSPAAGPAAAPRRPAAGDPRGLRRHDRADRRVGHGHGRVRPRRLGAGGRGLRRRADRLATADDARDGDGRHATPTPCSTSPPPSPTTPGSCRSSVARMAAGIPVEVVSDGFGFFIEPALVALGVGGDPGRHGADHVPGPEGAHRLSERPPDVPGLRDLQAAARARAPGRRARGRLHRRRRERPLRRGLQRRRVREAVAGADLPGGRLAVPALDRVRRDRRLADGDAGRLARGPGVAAGPARRGRSSAARRSGATASRTRCPGTGRRLADQDSPSGPLSDSIRKTPGGPDPWRSMSL